MEVSRAVRLQAHIDQAATDPVVWGKSDCCAWPASWVASEMRCSLALPSYSSRAEALKIIAAGGGLVALATNVLGRAGLVRTTLSPSVGDVGILEVTGGEVGVIFAQEGVAVWRRDTGGVLFLRPYARTVRAVWALP